ncbi:uncharacterized protein LOC106636964 isoform X3 [Copidosoma floridanum]|nr:uncharacterized protein LOC106636964 isoform X3 [Copidosoma floridanum]
MAETSQQQHQEVEEPKTNGIDLTEDEKSKMRPADIDADMKEMERRKRVEMMINSRLFREELERIIETQMKDGAGPSGLLQQISEMMGYQGARFNSNVFKNSNCVVPINDIRGVESMGYAKGEKLLRCKLAAVFRLLDLYGWTQGVGGMITARLNQDQEHFLVNPYGLLYHEVTASSLVKVDMQGNVVEQGTTNFGVHMADYQLHSTIHAARPDIKCIIHIATPSVTAISSLKCSLLPISQESIVIGEVSTHTYTGSLEPEEREKLARSIGILNKVLLLTNQGALCCGASIEEAFYNVYNTVLASETQLKLMPVGIDNLVLISDEARKAIYEASRKAPVPQKSSVAAESSGLAEKVEKRYHVGGTKFEALMRMLDNAGFRTGYIYRQPLVKTEPPRPRNDVEVPPAVSSLGYLLEEEELYKTGNWKFGRKGNDRTRWLNSPNVYQKVEILETGTPDPKKITKWVSDGSPTHSSTPVKIDGALMFVPKNTNPKEFKQLQQQIKDYRRADKISAGPQSHILEGVTWEEAKKMQDATISGTGEQVVLVGAASKGIIQRGFQHNAMVYKTPYAKNPFDQITDQELDQYKKEVERKTKGDGYDESQSESEGLSSFNISRATHDTSTAKSPVQSPVSVTSETEEESRDEPKVLRIETKQVPAPSQPEVVLSDGMSGVWSFSSSRSHSSEDSVSSSWMHDGSTNGLCKLERTRSQELARPMFPVLVDVAGSSTEFKNRIRKAKFFQNYENMMKKNINSNGLIVKSESDLSANNVEASSLDEEVEISDECQTAEEQFEQNLDITLTDVKFTKSADVDFAEKVDLSLSSTITENKDDTLLSPRLVKQSMEMCKSKDSIISNFRKSLDSVFNSLSLEKNIGDDNIKYINDENVVESVTKEKNDECTYKLKTDLINTDNLVDNSKENEKSGDEFDDFEIVNNGDQRTLSETSDTINHLVPGEFVVEKDTNEGEQYVSEKDLLVKNEPCTDNQSIIKSNSVNNINVTVGSEAIPSPSDDNNKPLNNSPLKENEKSIDEFDDFEIVNNEDLSTLSETSDTINHLVPGEFVVEKYSSTSEGELYLSNKEMFFNKESCTDNQSTHKHAEENYPEVTREDASIYSKCYGASVLESIADLFESPVQMITNVEKENNKHFGNCEIESIIDEEQINNDLDETVDKEQQYLIERDTNIINLMEEGPCIDEYIGTNEVEQYSSKEYLSFNNELFVGDQNVEENNVESDLEDTIELERTSSSNSSQFDDSMPESITVLPVSQMQTMTNAKEKNYEPFRNCETYLTENDESLPNNHLEENEKTFIKFDYTKTVGVEKQDISETNGKTINLVEERPYVNEYIDTNEVEQHLSKEDVDNESCFDDKNMEETTVENYLENTKELETIPSFQKSDYDSGPMLKYFIVLPVNQEQVVTDTQEENSKPTYSCEMDLIVNDEPLNNDYLEENEKSYDNLEIVDCKKREISSETDEKIIDPFKEEPSMYMFTDTKEGEQYLSNEEPFVENELYTANQSTEENYPEVTRDSEAISASNNSKCEVSMLDDLTASSVNQVQEMTLISNGYYDQTRNSEIESSSISSNHSKQTEVKDPFVENLMEKLWKVESDVESRFTSDQSQDETVHESETTDGLSDGSVKIRKKNLSKRASESPSVNKNYDRDSSDEECNEKKSQVLKSLKHLEILELTYSELERSSDNPSSRNSTVSYDDLVVKRNPDERRDSLVELINMCVDSNRYDTPKRPSTRITLERLQNAQISAKYNKDMKHVTDLYRLNPGYETSLDSDLDTTLNTVIDNRQVNSELLCENQFVVSGDVDNKNSFGPTSDEEKDTENRDYCLQDETESDVDNEDTDENSEDIIWLEISKGDENDANVERSEASFQSNVSNQGSDILELSSQTFQELKTSNHDEFIKNISSSVDEIIEELNNSPDDKRGSNLALYVPSDVTKCSALELTIYAEQIAVLQFVKHIIKDLVDRLPCYGDDFLTSSQVGSCEVARAYESTDSSVYVISEVIHHFVDKEAGLDAHDLKSKIIVTDKEVKESVNKELKNLKDDYDAEDEQSMKCSTPKHSPSVYPSGSNNFSESSEEEEAEVASEILGENEICGTVVGVATDLSKNQQVPITAAVSSVSSSSAESHHPVEPETTDNDTKSDNSKEKQTDSSENLKNQSKSSSDHSSSKISSDSLNAQADEAQEECTELENGVNNKVTFSVISCGNKNDSIILQEGRAYSESNSQDEGEDTSKKLTFCMIHYKGEYTTNSEDESKASVENVSENDLDFDTSFKEHWMQNQEELDQLWERTDALSEEIYKKERMAVDGGNAKSFSSDECDEEIQQISREILKNISPEFFSNEELNSLIFHDDNDCEDATTETHEQFEKVDDLKICTCYHSCTCCPNASNSSMVLQNMRSNSLSPINEDSEPEDSFVDGFVYREVDSFETLPPIYAEQEDSYTTDTAECDSRVTDFYSCQNSESMNSALEEQEILESTHSLSAEEASDYDNVVYMADVSANNNASDVSNGNSRDDSSVSERMNDSDRKFNVTDNLADESCISPTHGNHKSYIIECLTVSSHVEFLKLEKQCSDDSYAAGGTSELDSSLNNLFKIEDNRIICEAFDALLN